MTRSSIRTLVPLLGLTAGVGLILAAVFAPQLGIDRNADWGPSRRFMLDVGVALACLSLVLVLWRPVASLLRRSTARLRESRRTAGILGAWRRLTDWWTDKVLSQPGLVALRRSASRGLRRLRALPPVAWLLASPPRMAALGTILASAAVLVIYLWFVSVGRWDDWPRTTNHYNKLANAFLHGQLHLLIEPDPRLVGLEDPYDWESREEVNYIWDLVLFDGKYFLYWGPVPALVLATVKSVIKVEPGDPILVFFGVSAAFVAAALTAFSIWRRHFSQLPWWTAALPVVVLGLANPMPWLLNRPGVYEVAIGAGQAFLLAGMCLAISALVKTTAARWRLFFAGACWAAAVGSRASLAVVVIYLAAAAALRILQLAGRSSTNAWRLDWRSLAALFLPLALGAALLSGYNQARFGSFLEFGHRYQLGRWNKVEQKGRVFSPGYILPNSYNYGFNPFRRLSVFPYVKPKWGTHIIFPLHMTAPKPYHTEEITGVLVSSPFALYAVASPFLLWRARRRRRSEAEAVGALPASETDTTTLGWIHLMLGGGALFAFAPLAAFVSVTQRHLADVVPLVMILASVGFWQAHRALSAHPGRRRAQVLLATALIAYTAVVGLLLAITSYKARFENLNPVLFEQITRLLTW